MTQFISDTLPAGGQSSRGIRRILTGTWVDVAALFVLALCLWLPFGFNVSFWADEWWMFQDGGRLPWVALESSRPFVSIPWHIVYLFSPNSFTGTNVLLLLLIFGKGAAFYAILRRLVRQREIAFAAAATEFAVAGYEPTERFDSDGDLPLRAVTMLGMSPQDSRNSP